MTVGIIGLVARLPAYDLAGLDDLDAATADADLAVIVTAHPGIDFHALAEAVPTVDLRGVTRTPRAARVLAEQV
jgi:hypothetical protein